MYVGMNREPHAWYLSAAGHLPMGRWGGRAGYGFCSGNARIMKARAGYRFHHGEGGLGFLWTGPARAGSF